MIGRILVLGIALLIPATLAAGKSVRADGALTVAQASQIQKQRPSNRVLRERATPGANKRALQVSPLADLKAIITRLEPVHTIFNKRDDQILVNVTCLVRNVGNKPSTPTIARLRLESVIQTAKERILTKPIGALKPGENGHISWRTRMYGSQLQIRPKLNVRFYWRCEADPLPHEKGRFKDNNTARKYISVKAAYD